MTLCPALHLALACALAASANLAVASERVTGKLPSRLLGRDIHYTVVLPDGYAPDSQAQGATAPLTLYLLHGAGGNEKSWQQQGAVALLQAEMQRGRLPPPLCW